MQVNLLDKVAGTGDKAGNYYFTDFGEAAIYALIGLAVVFLGIVLIICVIWLLGLLMRKTNNLETIINKFKRKPEAQPEQKAVEMDAAQSDEIPDEVKAAIVAAIMAYYEESQEKCPFVVKKIRKV